MDAESHWKSYSLQMGWPYLPPLSWAASETARDIAKNYTQEVIGYLSAHLLDNYILYPTVWIEVYVENFCTKSNITTCV